MHLELVGAGCPQLRSKSLRRTEMTSRCLTLSAVLLLVSTPTFAQSAAHKMDAPKTPASKSDAQTSFETMKSLAGDWEGPVKTDLPVSANVDIKPIHASMRV